METLSSIKVDSQEKSTAFQRHKFFHNFSHETFMLSVTEVIRKRVQEIPKRYTPSKLVVAAVIFLVIGIFSVPIILYYSLKTNPIPGLNGVLGDVNISMVCSHVVIGATCCIHQKICCCITSSYYMYICTYTGV